MGFFIDRSEQDGETKIILSKRVVFYAALVALIFNLVTGSHAQAANIWPHIKGAGDYRAVVIEGPIQEGDFNRFEKIIRENQGKISTVFIYSHGGDFDEAMKIGRAMRALELNSMAPQVDSYGNPSCEKDEYDTIPTPKKADNCTCASACFFIHIGGVHRGGRFIAVHRPYFAKGKFGELSQENAEKEFNALQQRARDYMKEMSVPAHIQDDVLGTSSDNVLVLDDKTIKTHFWGQIPYIHEWIKNKCSVLSEPERIRLDNYGQKILSGLKIGENEQSDYGVLWEKQEKESECGLEVNRNRRVDAYEKYFGIKPDDTVGYDFSKWTGATKYFGREFYKILGEERFEESSLLKMNFLTRDATAHTPFIHLGDLPENSRVVSSVSLGSHPNPSDGFRTELVKHISAKWGDPEIKEGEYLWNHENTTAHLKEQNTAEGRLLMMEIDKN